MKAFLRMVSLLLLGITFANALPTDMQENLARKEFSEEDFKLMESLLSDEHARQLLENGPQFDGQGCEDIHNSVTCRYYADKFPGYCQGHEAFTKTYCRVTCGFCNKIPSPTKECKDYRAACELFANNFKGYCDYNSGFMTKNCPKACKFCQSKLPSPPIPDGGIEAKWSVGEWDKTCMSGKKARTVFCVHEENGTKIPVSEDMCSLAGDKPAEEEVCA